LVADQTLTVLGLYVLVINAFLMTVPKGDGEREHDLRDGYVRNAGAISLYKGSKIAFWVEVRVQMDHEPLRIERNVLGPCRNISALGEKPQRVHFVADEAKTVAVGGLVGNLDYVAGEILACESVIAS
jgi:hypothetical protein